MSRRARANGTRATAAKWCPLDYLSGPARGLDRISPPYVNPRSSPLDGAIALDALASDMSGFHNTTTVVLAFPR